MLISMTTKIVFREKKTNKYSMDGYSKHHTHGETVKVSTIWLLCIPVFTWYKLVNYLEN